MANASDFQGPDIDVTAADLNELKATFDDLRESAQIFAQRHGTIQNIHSYRRGELTVAEEHEFLEAMIDLAASGQLEALYEGLNTMALENEYLKQLLVATKKAGGGTDAIEKHVQHDAIAQRALVTLIENAQANPLPGGGGVQLTIRVRDQRLWEALQELARQIKENAKAVKVNRVSPRQQYEARKQQETAQTNWTPGSSQPGGVVHKDPRAGKRKSRR